MAEIDNVLARGIGGDILAGSTARYHQAEASRIANEASNALAIAPDVPAALHGDTEAFGRVAAKSPKTADVLGQALQRMNASQAAHTLAVANYAGNTSAGILAAPPEARGALYDQAKVDAAKAGMDTANWPAQYNEGWVKFQQAKAAGAKAAFEADAHLRLKQTPGARAAGSGGGEEVIPDGTTPGPQSAIPGPAAPVVVQAAPPDVSGSPPAPAGPVVAQAPPVAPAAPQMAQAGAPTGFQPMGHRDPQGNLVPAMINGQAVHRNPQTGEMVLVPSAAPPVVAQAAPVDPRAAGSDSALSSGAPGDQPPGSALPDGTQLAQNTPKPGAIIYDDPAQLGGKMLGVKQPNGTYKPVEGPGGTVKYRLPDGTAVYYGPHLKDPNATERTQAPQGYRWGKPDADGKQTMEAIPGGPADLARKNVAIGITPENENLHGDEFVQTLPKGDQNIINGLTDGSLSLSDLSKRAQDYTRYVALAKQADPSFEAGPAGARRNFETKFMVNGQGGTTMLAANTAADHMKLYRDVMEAQGNGDSKMLNAALNAVRNQFGEAAASNPKVAQTVLATEIAKAVRGAGALNEAEQQDYQKVLSTAQGAQQAQGTLETLSSLMMGRVHAIEDMARSRGVPDAQVSGYLSPRARQAMDYIKNTPIKGSQEPSLYERVFGAPRPADADSPAPVKVATPEDAMKLEKGTTFVTPDGRVKVRP